jgi:hypothetical protein
MLVTVATAVARAVVRADFMFTVCTPPRRVADAVIVEALAVS